MEPDGLMWLVVRGADPANRPEHGEDWTVPTIPAATTTALVRCDCIENERSFRDALAAVIQWG